MGQRLAIALGALVLALSASRGAEPWHASRVVRGQEPAFATEGASAPLPPGASGQDRDAIVKPPPQSSGSPPVQTIPVRPREVPATPVAEPLFSESFFTPSATGRWSGGMGLMVARPFFENNPAYTIERYSWHQQIVVQPPVPPPEPPPPIPVPIPAPPPPTTKGNFLASQLLSSSNSPPSTGVSTTSQPPVSQPQQQPGPQPFQQRYLHSIRKKDFNPEFEIVPRLWLEWQGDDGVGVRARFFRFEQHLEEAVFNPAAGVNGEPGEVEVFSAEPLGLFIASPGPLLSGLLQVGGAAAIFNGSGADFLLMQSSLELWAIDLEATEQGHAGTWQLLASAGLRYAHLAQSYNAFRFNRDNVPGLANVEADAAVLLSGHHFKGLGPTVALEAKRPLGESGFALYGQARGSLLFGKHKHEAHLAAVLAGFAVDGGLPEGPFVERSFVDARRDHDDVLPVAELEAGLEWRRDLPQSRLLIQAGVSAQNWFGAGGAATEDGNLGFLGLILSVGLEF